MPVSESTRAILRLSLVRGIGPRLGRQLIGACGSAVDVWHRKKLDWATIPGIGVGLIASLQAADERRADDVLGQCQRSNIHVLSMLDPAYPQLLKNQDDSPLILFARGDISALNQGRMLAVVGTRRASREGRLLAQRWSQFLGGQGVTIVSGMAYGIDQAAHQGALAGSSATVAVLGCGLNALNAGQLQLATAIADKGCLISEFTPACEPRPENFPRRNRIIAGMTHATLVVEAGLKSGAMITAHLALDYGREVLAVPGSVLGDAHAGCHQLLREGAAIITSGQDVLQLMGWEPGGRRMRIDYVPESQAEARVLATLQSGTMHVDQLAEALGLTMAELSPILIGLELIGVVECLPGSRYALAVEATSSAS